jgi:hypothetical protein
VSAYQGGIVLLQKLGSVGGTGVLAMKKARKKSVTQKPARPPTGKGKKGPITKQPEIKQQAAVAHGMFLYVDDAWSLRYFDQNDLHFKEREVFG